MTGDFEPRVPGRVQLGPKPHYIVRYRTFRDACEGSDSMAYRRRSPWQMQAATEQVAVAPSSSPARPPKPRPGMMRQYDLVERVRSYNPDTNEDLLNRAYVYAMKAHGAQTRASGDPFFSHPLEVAAILTDLKLDDRLHNMRTLEFVAPTARRRIAEETLDIYAPLAGRMGMQEMREELEDLSFRTLD